MNAISSSKFRYSDADGTDMLGVGTQDEAFGGKDPMEIAKLRVEAGFERIL